MREFEFVERAKDINGKLPERSTAKSAGYDFEYPFEGKFIIGPHEICYIPTGIKVKLPDDEYLQLCNRSSNPKKKKLILINGVGIIDADYYNNPDNEGEIAFAFYNMSNDIIEINKGDKLGQGIFCKYGKTDNDTAEGERTGGFGSTGK